MRSTGMVRRVDKLGRIVIPKEICKTLDIKGGSKGTGTPMEIFVDREGIVIRKYQVGCYCCGAITKQSTEIFDREICPKCYQDFKNQMNLIDKLRGAKNDNSR